MKISKICLHKAKWPEVITSKMPYVKEHSCRLRDPSDFQKESFRRTERKHNGKSYFIIVGRLKGKTTMTEQAFRYDRKTWSASSAKEHCKSHNGRFEAAILMSELSPQQKMALGYTKT